MEVPFRFGRIKHQRSDSFIGDDDCNTADHIDCGILHLFIAIYRNKRYHGCCCQPVSLVDFDQSGDTADHIIYIGDTRRFKHDDGLSSRNGRVIGLFGSCDLFGRILCCGYHCISVDFTIVSYSFYAAVVGISIVIDLRKRFFACSFRRIYRDGK